MEDFKAQFDASQVEIANLKNVLEQYQANKQALETTTQELLAANINFKASELLSAQKISRVQNELVALKAEVAKKEEEAKAAASEQELIDAA